mgnify:CR=1 FL=1
MSSLDNYNEIKPKLDEIRNTYGDLEFNAAVTFLMQIGWEDKRTLIALCNEYQFRIEKDKAKIAKVALILSNTATPIQILTYVKLECPLWIGGIEPKRLKRIAEDVINAGYRYCKDPRVDKFEDWKKLLKQQYGITHEELQQILYLNERGEV